MNRRNFLARAGTLLAASSLPAAGRATGLTDCHVYLGAQPFRRLGAEDTAAFARALAARGVTEAWAGAFEGLLRRDVAAVNQELAEKCRAHPLLRPCGSINLSLPAWQDDVRRCAEEHGMRVIRLHPNHHGWTLETPAFRELLDLAAEKNLRVQLVAQMEDTRTQHPLVRAEPVDLRPLPALMRAAGGARVILHNANAAMVLRHLQDCPDVWLDFAMIEGVGGVENLLKSWPLERVVFGSYAPVFYWESARLKMRESALDAPQEKALTHANAEALLA